MIDDPHFWHHLLALGLIAGAVVLTIVVLSDELVDSNRRVKRARADALLTDWADAAGYELLSVSGGTRVEEPGAGEFGFAYHGRPGVVLRVVVRDGVGRIRRGWAFVAVRTPAGMVPLPADGELEADFVEVAWDE